MRQGRDFGHDWSLPHSLRADVNGWCSCHDISCRSNSLFWHCINHWKRSENTLSWHSVKLGLLLVLLLDISSACLSLTLCYVITGWLFFLQSWKILITNTSALLVGQNKFYWTVVGNVLYMSGTQISIVLIVLAHSLQQKSYQLSFNAFCWVCIWYFFFKFSLPVIIWS